MMKTLNAIHDNDLIELLKSLGIYDRIIQGKIRCKFTDCIITLDNFHAVIPDSGNISCVCDSSDAIKQLSNYLNEKNAEFS